MTPTWTYFCQTTKKNKIKKHFVNDIKVINVYRSKPAKLTKSIHQSGAGNSVYHYSEYSMNNQLSIQGACLKMKAFTWVPFVNVHLNRAGRL